MLATKLENLNQLQALVNSLAMTKVQAANLNRVAGNAMRRIVRKNIKQQQDIHGKQFKPRKKSNYTQAKSGKISLNTKMFRAAARYLNQDADADGVAVGYSGKAAHVLRKHNAGLAIKFKRRSTGKYVNYKMPKREFLGWSQEMLKEVENSVMNEYLKFAGAH